MSKKEVKEYRLMIGNLDFGTFLSSDESIETKKPKKDE